MFPAIMPTDMAAQEVGLVDLDVKDVATGFRAETLKLKTVVNEKGELIGKIDDFIFSRDGGEVFVVVAVGDLTGVHGNLVAVPFQKLQFGDGFNKVVLPGSKRAVLTKLPVFLYEE